MVWWKPISEWDPALAQPAINAAASHGRVIFASLAPELVPPGTYIAWITTCGRIYTDCGRAKPINFAHQTENQRTVIHEAIAATYPDLLQPTGGTLEHGNIVRNPQRDMTNPAHNLHLEVLCEAGKCEVRASDQFKNCNVRRRKRERGLGHRVCTGTFRYSIIYRCERTSYCPNRREEVVVGHMTDCGRHGDRPKKYGINGKGTWDVDFDREQIAKQERVLEEEQERLRQKERESSWLI